uniref:Albumin 1 n=1 Tax=Clitoria ternatea TaxID=43366 RepID=A0A0S1RQI1_CLITE|nr:albumin 1 [Clitoria ternatea]
MFTLTKTEGGSPLLRGETCVLQTCYTPGCSCTIAICLNNHIIVTNAKTGR